MARCPGLYGSILLAVSAVTCCAHAQHYAFQPLRAPAGGPVHSVLPLPDGGIIVGTSYHIFSSVKGDTSWTKRATSLGGYQFGSLARDSAGMLYAAIGEGLESRSNLFRSTDNGATWQPSRNGIPGTAEISSLAADRAGNTYAATYGLGLYRSSDHGSSWHAVAVRNSRDSTILNLYGIRFAGGHGTPLYLTANFGVYRSVDSGTVWRACAQTEGTAGPNVIVDSVGAIYLGGRGTLARSTDSGVTFATLIAQPGLPSAFLLTRHGTLLGLRGDTLFRSADGGVSWKPELVCPYFLRVHDYAADGDMVFLATNQGLFRSTDDCLTWQAASTGLIVSTVTDLAADSSGAVLAAAPGQGIFRSGDNGASWNNLGPQGAGAYPGYYYAGTVACDAIGHLYALSLDSIHVSTNGGGSWSVPRNTNEPLGGSNILTAPNGLALTAFTEGAGGSNALARSTDYGASWITYSIYPTGSAYRFQMLGNGHLFAATSNSIMYSLDTGRTWRQRGTGIPDNRPARELLATRSGALLAATPNGLFRTTDEGVTWAPLTTPFAADSVRRMIQLRSNRILALVPPRLFASDDEGTSWDTAYAGELQLTQIVESANGDLYAGIAGEGLARRTHTVEVPVAVDRRHTIAVQSVRLEANGTLTLRYSVTGPGDVEIFDIAGHAVAGMPFANGAATEQSLRIPDHFAPGLYLCRLRAGGNCVVVPVAVR
ncbi:MAG: hypothetical protein JST22_15325 [Bacteroidetes bacterium]|nr:hypothetical protein [Bacteroidota bacterium]